MCKYSLLKLYRNLNYYGFKCKLREILSCFRCPSCCRNVHGLLMRIFETAFRYAKKITQDKMCTFKYNMILNLIV